MEQIQNKKSFLGRFWWIWIIVLVLSTSGATIFVSNNPKLREIITGIPACPADLSGLFTVSMIKVDQLAAIEPMGFVNGADHVLPVSFVSFTAKDANKPISPTMLVYAPTDIFIYGMQKSLGYDDEFKEEVVSYSMFATICGDVSIGIYELKELSQPIKELYERSKKYYESGEHNVGIGFEIETVRVKYHAKAGEIIGSTGKGGFGLKNEGLEVDVINHKLKPANVDMEYYGEAISWAKSVCPLDLYAGELKEALYGKLGHYDIKIIKTDKRTYIDEAATPVFIPRLQEPRCGKAIQDIPGTVQGNWFAGRPKNILDNLESQGKTLAFIHKNNDPSKTIISVGGNFMDTGVVEFVAKKSGRIDRKPSEVKADGNIYCYNVPRTGHFEEGGKIILELLDDHNLKVEYQSGVCGLGESFDNPFNYQR